jgi:cyclohexanecarboxyl-CoA dehydrogenase
MGVAQGVARRSLGYAKEREAFGKPIGERQGVSFPLAEAKPMYEACAQPVSAHLMAEGPAPSPHRRGGHVQVVGTEAGLRNHPPVPADPRPWRLRQRLRLRQRYRDVLGLQIGDGTANIMKMIIARQKACA